MVGGLKWRLKKGTTFSLMKPTVIKIPVLHHHILKKKFTQWLSSFLKKKSDLSHLISESDSLTVRDAKKQVSAGGHASTGSAEGRVSGALNKHKPPASERIQQVHA
jgi:hypothetical protein